MAAGLILMSDCTITICVFGFCKTFQLSAQVEQAVNYTQNDPSTLDFSHLVLKPTFSVDDLEHVYPTTGSVDVQLYGDDGTKYENSFAISYIQANGGYMLDQPQVVTSWVTELYHAGVTVNKTPTITIKGFDGSTVNGFALEQNKQVLEHLATSE